MLKLQLRLKEGIKAKVEDAVQYEVLLGEQKVGTFRFYLKTKADHGDMCGWADQYHGEYYWGDKDTLLRFVLSTQIKDGEPQSFILISDLVWEFQAVERFVKGISGADVSIAEKLLKQLEELRVKHQADACYIPLKHDDFVRSQWETVLKGLGYEPIVQTDLEVTSLIEDWN